MVTVPSAQPSSSAASAGLSDREVEVLQVLAQGVTDWEIAAAFALRHGLA